MVFQHLGTVLENSLDVRADQPAMDKPAERSGIADAVSRQRASVPRLERVLVNPLPIGTANLFVLEAVGRLPRVDTSAPPQR